MFVFVCFFFSFSLSGLTWEKYSSSDFGAFQFKDVLDFLLDFNFLALNVFIFCTSKLVNQSSPYVDPK